jgi:hypothetical protein
VSLIPAGPIMNHGGRDKRETIRYALDDTARTIRLVAIFVAVGIACSTPFLVMLLARHWMG